LVENELPLVAAGSPAFSVDLSPRELYCGGVLRTWRPVAVYLVSTSAPARCNSSKCSYLVSVPVLRTFAFLLSGQPHLLSYTID
jgi:hypothetical protein